MALINLTLKTHLVSFDLFSYFSIGKGVAMGLVLFNSAWMTFGENDTRFGSVCKFICVKIYALRDPIWKVCHQEG